MKTINEIFAVTEKEIIEAATKFVLFRTNLQVTKVTKVELLQFSRWGEKITIENKDRYRDSDVFYSAVANVRTDNQFKKAKTIKVKVFTRGIDNKLWCSDATGSLSGMFFSEVMATTSENPDYSSISKEQGAINLELHKNALAEEKAEEKRQRDIKSIIDEINYNTNPESRHKRSPKQLKTSFKKYSSDVLNEAKIKLDNRGAELLDKVITELQLPTVQNAASLLSTVTNCNVYNICKDLEATFEKESIEFYNSVLSWLIAKQKEAKKEANKHGYTFFPKSDARLKLDAEYIVESNKFKLFGCVIRNLGQYPIASVNRISFRNNVQGFEGSWELTLKDGKNKLFHARSIIADGYHVCRHYRYIGTVKG